MIGPAVHMERANNCLELAMSALAMENNDDRKAIYCLMGAVLILSRNPVREKYTGRQYRRGDDETLQHIVGMFNANKGRHLPEL